MKFLVQLYPGDQFMLLVATVIGQVAVIVVLGFVLTRFPKRRSAATRSAIWLAALVCVLLTPLFACGFGFAEVELVRLPLLARAEPETEPQVPMRTSQGRAAPDAAAAMPQPEERTEKPAGRQSHVSVSAASPRAIESASPSSELTPFSGADQWRAAAACGLLLWFAGVSVFAVRFLYGCLILKHLRAGARPANDRAVAGIHQNVCRVLGTRRDPQIMTSPHVDGPIATNGWRGPMVILPDKLLRGLKDHQLRDVLMHECAHLLQRDILLGVLQRIAQIIYWPHPMVHLLNRDLSRAREDICDNYVVQQGDAPGYARTLVQLSTALPHHRTPIAACGMFSPISRLETRIETLLDEGRDLMTRTKRSLLFAFGLFFLGISVLSFGCRLVEARGPDDAAEEVNQADEEQAEDDRKAAPAITGRILFKAGGAPTRRPASTAPGRHGDVLPVISRLASDEQRNAVAALMKLGAEVGTLREATLAVFDQEYDDTDDHFDLVVSINLDGKRITDKDLAHLECLTDLVELNLDRTPITDEGLEHLKRLKKLRCLLLIETHVTAAGLAQLEDLTELRVLDLSRTQVTDEGLPHLAGLAKMKNLQLDGTPVTDAGLAHLKGLTKLRKFRLQGTKVTPSGAKELLKSLPECDDYYGPGREGYLELTPRRYRLRPEPEEQTDRAPGRRAWGAQADESLGFSRTFVGFHGEEITDADLVHVKDFPQLMRLHLAEMPITDAGLAHLEGLTKLEELDLNATEITDAGLAHLKGMRNLVSLNLNYTAVTDAGLAHLEDLTSLESLELADAPITDAGLAHLENLTRLRELDLSRVVVSDAGMPSLAPLTRLELLDLEGTRITDAGLAHLEGLTELEELRLDRTGVTEQGARDLMDALPQIDRCRWPTGQYLDRDD